MLLAKQPGKDRRIKPIISPFLALVIYISVNTLETMLKRKFYYNHKVNDKIRTNLLLLKGEFTSPRFHAALGLMTGDYSQFNLSAEPNWAKPLNEAFVGIKLSKKKRLWWDAGVYSSYIGIESAVSSDCPTLTRSIVAENSPITLAEHDCFTQAIMTRMNLDFTS